MLGVSSYLTTDQPQRLTGGQRRFLGDTRQPPVLGRARARLESLRIRRVRAHTRAASGDSQDKESQLPLQCAEKFWIQLKSNFNSLPLF